MELCFYTYNYKADGTSFKYKYANESYCAIIF